MSTRIATIAAILILAVSAAANPCDTTTTYYPCRWIETICYPDNGGWCDGYWDCDSQTAYYDTVASGYSDGSTLYQRKDYNQYDQLVKCRRWCACPNPNDCDAKDAFNGGAYACPTP